MEVNEGRSGSAGQSHVYESDPAAPALLQEEWLLKMVFGHLVEYGLEDCRLVCRKWRDVCQEFITKLSVETVEELDQALAAFPNPVSVSLIPWDAGVEDIDFFSRLLTNHKLRNLEFCVRDSNPQRYGQHDFQSITQLTDLNLHFKRIPDSFELLDSVRHLTNLTKLLMIFPGWHPPPVKPFVELKEIRNLSVNYPLFADANGECFFPSLTNLTSLEMKTSQDPNPGVVISLQALTNYGPNIQELNLLPGDTDPAEIDFEPLKSLTALNTVQIGEVALTRNGFWDAVRNKPSITKLSCPAVGCIDAFRRDSIASLNQLRVLDFQCTDMHSGREKNISLAPLVTQLTELSITVDGPLLSDLGCLTNLVILNLKVYVESDCSLDDSLVQMPHLESLAVHNMMAFLPRYFEDHVEPEPGRLSISSGALLGAKQLRSLTLLSVSVNELFFQDLTSMPKLTKLRFERVEEVASVESYIYQIHQLEHLEELELYVRYQCLVCCLISPAYLPRLTKLSIRDSTEGDDTLRKRWTSRPQVMINGPQRGTTLCAKDGRVVHKS